jgi:hypothetical protein
MMKERLLVLEAWRFRATKLHNRRSWSLLHTSYDLAMIKKMLL